MTSEGHNSTELGAETTTWRPDQNEHPVAITGELIDVRTVHGPYGAYPLLALLGEDGLAWSIHAFRDVLKSELADIAPQIGDKIQIVYLGRHPGKGYYRYQVRRVGGEPRTVDWTRFGDSAPVEPEVSIDASDLPPVGRSLADRARDEFGDDPPAH